MIRCGTTAHGSGKPAPGPSTQTPVETEALGRAHVPLDVVADHPGVLGARGEGGESVAVHRLLGLAASELAFDDHHVEIAREVVLLDLPALLAPVAIGHEAHRDPAAPQASERRGDAGKEAHALPAMGGEALGEVARQRPALGAETGQGVLGNRGPRAHHVHARRPMPIRIVPEPATGAENGLGQRGRIDAGGLGHRATGLTPGLFHAPRVVEQGIVEVDEQGLHVWATSR